MGRPPGSTNKTSKETREAFKLIFDDNLAEFNQAMKMLFLEDPKAFVQSYIQMAKHFVPALTAISGDSEGGPVQVVIEKLTRKAADLADRAEALENGEDDGQG